MPFLADSPRAIFSLTGHDSAFRIGTAVAISEDLLVTCEHVVKDAKEVTLLSHHPVFEGENAKGKVIRTDKSLDLALLRSSSRLPFFLQPEDKEEFDDSEPLRVWSWPGWIKWEKAFEKALEGKIPGKKEMQDLSRPASKLTPAPHAAVMTDSWEEDNPLSNLIGVSLFSFAGHIEGGMSGGPVVSVLTNKIVGIVTQCYHPPKDLQEVTDTWYLDVPPRIIEAQLELGMGIAVSLKELKTFLDSKAPEAL